MEKPENLYDLLNKKIKENMANDKNLEKEKKQALIDCQYHEAEARQRYVTNQIKAYYYFQFFIINVFPKYIKKQIHVNTFRDIEKIKKLKFDFELIISNSANKDIEIEESRNIFFISFKNYDIYSEFIYHLNLFCMRCHLNISDEYANGRLYFFDKLTIEDALITYYKEFQGFEFTDELITSIQEEENTNVDGKALIKKINNR